MRKLGRLGGLMIAAAGGLVALGFGMAAVAELLGEENPLGWPLWLLGLLACVVAIPVFLVGGIGVILGWAFSPPEPSRRKPPEVPMPGWPGWELTVDGVPHEVWLATGGWRFKVACDGRWVTTRTVDRTHVAFNLAGHPAVVSVRRDRHGTPIPRGAALHMSDEGYLALRFSRWSLEVDGVPRPESERRIAVIDAPDPSGPTRHSQSAGATAASGSVEPPAPSGPTGGSGRQLRPNPPRR
jgi:hypothetical protein